MVRLIYLWLEKLACKHKWKVHKEVHAYKYEDSKTPFATRQTLICSECGEIKKIKL